MLDLYNEGATVSTYRLTFFADLTLISGSENVQNFISVCQRQLYVVQKSANNAQHHGLRPGTSGRERHRKLYRLFNVLN